MRKYIALLFFIAVNLFAQINPSWTAEQQRWARKGDIDQKTGDVIDVGLTYGYTNTAITEAITALGDGGGTLLFGDSTWVFTNYVSLSGKKGITFKSVNKNKAHFTVATNIQIGQMFYGVDVENIVFDGIYAESYATYPNDTTYHKNSTYNKNAFIYFQTATDIQVLNNKLEGFSKHCINIKYGDGIYIQKNRFYKASFSSKNIIIEYSNTPTDNNFSKNIWIEDNVFGKFGTQKQITMGSSNDVSSVECIHIDDSRYFHILNNVIDSSSSHGIRIEESQFGEVRGNIISNSGWCGIFLYSNTEHVTVDNNNIYKFGAIPPTNYIYKYAGKLYNLTEYKWGIVKFGNSNPALANLVEEYPYVFEGDTSSTTVFDTTTLAVYPQRGFGGIHLSYYETYSNIISNNIIEGDLTQVGGKYTHANKYGIVLGMHYYNGGSTTNTTGDNIVSNNFVKNIIESNKQIYSPQYQDSTQSKGAQLYTNKFSGNKASLQNGVTFTARD